MNIEVNHAYLGNAARAMDSYVNFINSNMNVANGLVDSALKKDWLGSDADAFKSKWAMHSIGNSITEMMKAELRNQANMLRYAESQYKDAQSKAVGRAYFLW